MITKASLSRKTEEERRVYALQDEKKKTQTGLLKKDFNTTFASSSGKRVLRWLMERCGYQKPSAVVDPATGKYQTESTIHNEARRILYLEIREFLTPDILGQVENKGLEQDEDLLT